VCARVLLMRKYIYASLIIYPGFNDNFDDRYNETMKGESCERKTHGSSQLPNIVFFLNCCTLQSPSIFLGILAIVAMNEILFCSWHQIFQVLKKNLKRFLFNKFFNRMRHKNSFDVFFDFFIFFFGLFFVLDQVC